MKDFFGRPLAKGDVVAFEQPSYRNLVQGIVIGFTPKQVKVEWVNPQYSNDHKSIYTTPPNHLVKRDVTNGN